MASTARLPVTHAGDLDPPLSQLKQITRAVSAIYKEQYGRGPRFAHSHFSGPNAICCFLEGTLTPVERTLAELHEHQRLREVRLLFQYAAEDSFRSAVEAITSRKVVAFMSGIDARADVASELFLLEPVEPEEPALERAEHPS